MMRKGRRRLIHIVILLGVAAALLVGVFLFRVQKVTVTGNSRYSSEQIEEDLLTGFWSRNTLFLWWNHKDGDIPDSMPYLESMKITIKTPISISVEVSEKELIGYFDTGSYAYFDESGIVLQITDELYDGVPVITGASTGEITLYQKVPTESSSQLRTILSLLELLNYHELSADEIRFAENSEITVYIGNIEAILGQDEYLEEKIANLKAILNMMSDTSAGTLHLENVTGNNEDITFTPSGEEIEETETETEMTETEENTVADSSGEVDAGSDTSTAEDADSSDSASDDSGSSDEEEASDDEESEVDLMVFNSSGQLVNNVHVRNGVVVDSDGNEVPGCSVNEDGYVVDAYMNIIDPATGELMN